MFAVSLFFWWCLSTSLRFFLPRGHIPPPTLRDHLNSHICLQCRRFPVRCYTNRLDVTLYAIGISSLSPSRPTLSAPHPKKVYEHYLLWQPPAAHSDKRPRSKRSSRTQRYLNAFTLRCLEVTVVRGHPTVWSFALCSDNPKQDPVCTVWSLE